MLRVELDQKIISDDHRVFVLHAGKNKIFYDDFASYSRIFMDLPGLELKTNFQLDDMTRRQIQRANAYAYFYRRGHGDVPPADIEQYDPSLGLAESDYPQFNKRSFNSLELLYSDAVTGDLVVIPGRGYETPVLIGELLPLDEQDGKIRPAFISKYEAQAPSRKVKWLNRSQTRLGFSLEFVKALSNGQALIMLPNSLKKEAYDYAYGNYAVSDTSSIRIFVEPSGEDKQVSIDPLPLRHATDLVMYFNAIYNAIFDPETGGDIPDDLRNMAISQAVMSEYYKARPLAFEADLHSPGDVVYRAANNVKKLAVIGALIAICGCGSMAYAELSSGIELVNTWNVTPDDCDLQISEEIRTIMNLMGAELFENACEARKLAGEALSIDTNTTASITPANAPALVADTNVTDDLPPTTEQE